MIMAVLRFSLDPAALGKLHDALVCLGRFHESVCLEATRDHVSHSNWIHWHYIEWILTQLQLVLSSLNCTKTGYAAFTFVGDKFFTKYVYSPPRIAGKTIEKFTCRIYNKVHDILVKTYTSY